MAWIEKNLPYKVRTERVIHNERLKNDPEFKKFYSRPQGKAISFIVYILMFGWIILAVVKSIEILQ